MVVPYDDAEFIESHFDVNLCIVIIEECANFHSQIVIYAWVIVARDLSRYTFEKVP